jgi:hypothetical protein
MPSVPWFDKTDKVAVAKAKAAADFAAWQAASTGPPELTPEAEAPAAEKPLRRCSTRSCGAAISETQFAEANFSLPEANFIPLDLKPTGSFCSKCWPVVYKETIEVLKEEQGCGLCGIACLAGNNYEVPSVPPLRSQRPP